MSNKWLTFWKEENAFDNTMGINYAFFLKKVEKYVTPSPGSKVLDVGSGPGNLEDVWYSRVGEIHGVDISERYNRMAAEKHKDHSNVFFHTLREDDYLNFSMLGDKKFDIIIVMSVLQYYRNRDEVVDLIERLKELAAPGCTLLLCDLIIRSSFVSEVVQVLTGAFKEGKLLSTLALFFKLRFSSYYKVKKEAGFLVLSDNDWQSIIDQLGLKARFTDEPLTLQKDRKNLVIYL
jgi:2-polyprenyl-3-methyl-5-hydroxy-6-metoxy-1,4-benzoquinol methylase